MLTLVPTREINYSTPFSFLFVQKWLFSHRNRQEALLFVQTNPGGLKAGPSRGAFPPPSDHGRICGREFWAGYCFGWRRRSFALSTPMKTGSPGQRLRLDWRRKTHYRASFSFLLKSGYCNCHFDRDRFLTVRVWVLGLKGGFRAE